MLCLTGGVAKSIDDVCMGQREPQGRMSAFQLLHAPDKQIFSRFLLFLLRAPSNVVKLTSGGPWPEAMAITEVEAHAYLAHLGVEPFALLRKWCDSGVFIRVIRDGAAFIELLYPYQVIPVLHYFATKPVAKSPTNAKNYTTRHCETLPCRYCSHNYGLGTGMGDGQTVPATQVPTQSTSPSPQPCTHTSSCLLSCIWTCIVSE